MNTAPKTQAVILGSLLSLSALTHAASSAVVGYTSTTLPAGTSLFAPSFVNSASASGALAGVSTSTLTVAGLSTGAYDEGTNFPLYYVEITNDTASDGLDTEGLILDVVSNTETSIVVGSDAVALGVQGDESYVIRKHLTLTDISDGSTDFDDFEGATLYNATGVGSIDTFVLNGGVWSVFDANVPGFVPRPNVPVHPGTGVAISTIDGVTLLVTGEVKESPTQVSLYGGGIPNFVGLLKPIVNYDIDDGALSSLVDFEGFTTYTDGTLVPTSAVVLAGQVQEFDPNVPGFVPTTFLVDGTSDAVIFSTQTDKVYKVSGTSIPQ